MFHFIQIAKSMLSIRLRLKEIVFLQAGCKLFRNCNYDRGMHVISLVANAECTRYYVLIAFGLIVNVRK